MLSAKIRVTDNYTRENYVVGVQEPFGIVTLGTIEQANKYPLEHALRLIDLVSRTSNGHWKLIYELCY